MKDVRQGYYSEQSRKDSYLDIINDKDSRGVQYKIILMRLVNYGESTMQELEEFTGIKVHIISARLNELREMGVVTNPAEMVFDKKAGKEILKAKRRLYEPTGKRNILWSVVAEKQLQINF